jgi:pimeloyl-ACP methyl ester carboxylesterase
MPACPVVLVHGVGSSFEHNWRATGWVDLLEAEGRSVIGVELPGHGREPGDPNDDPADRVLAQCLAGEPVDAVGFSAGGHALLGAAARAPRAFRRLAVLGVALPDHADTDAGDDGSAPSADAIAEALDGEIEPPPGPARVIRRLVATAGNDPRAVAQFVRARRPVLRRADLAHISAPVLVVIGEHDFVGPADELVAALPSATLVTLPGVDHFATPTDFRGIDAVLRFLAG